ncbi:MAG: ABC transporter permease [Chitinophagales bacterium]|jgi:putative ABC transport system permease protein|nr:ABC transporter permease [Sphingobacteriales bacterium]MBP7534214.1 ABC transporter permease [Chitinophagales bacterium]
MLTNINIFISSILLTLQELWSHRLRAFLSILGISIGIFCMVSVKMMVDSVERNVKSSFNRLGDNVVFIDRFPWTQEADQKWWIFLKRPMPSYQDFKKIQEKVQSAKHVAIRGIMMGADLKYLNNTVSNLPIAVPTHELADILNMEFSNGRFFAPIESSLGSPVIVLGNNVAAELFPNIDPIGKQVRFMGRMVRVVGVLKREGKSILGDGFDDVALVPYNYLRRYTNLDGETFRPLLFVQAKDGVSIDQLKDEITGVLRAERKLRPTQEDNFALNQLSLLTSLLDGIFVVLNVAGGIIGMFALLVGGFGIANIMFVSVKERTGMIGIKKSLGAKRRVILFEFLFEAIVLSIIGGFIGLLLVIGLANVGNRFVDAFEMVVSVQNVYFGIIISVIIGIVAGFIPALQASRMNPVEAIRQNF